MTEFTFAESTLSWTCTWNAPGFHPWYHKKKKMNLNEFSKLTMFSIDLVSSYQVTGERYSHRSRKDVYSEMENKDFKGSNRVAFLKVFPWIEPDCKD